MKNEMSFTNEVIEIALEILDKAVDKQIPKAIKNISDDGIERYFCDCGNIMHRKQKYCDICGQALDWGDEND